MISGLSFFKYGNRKFIFRGRRINLYLIFFKCHGVISCSNCKAASIGFNDEKIRLVVYVFMMISDFFFKKYEGSIFEFFVFKISAFLKNGKIMKIQILFPAFQLSKCFRFYESSKNFLETFLSLDAPNLL